MKKLILIAILILCLPSVFALYGGETQVYNFPECDSLTVNITSSNIIEPNEYSILNNNCTETPDNFYVCECTDGYNFTLSFSINTINTYNILFNYNYSTYIIESPKRRSSSSGSSGGGGIFTVRFKDNKPVNLTLKKYINSRFWVNSKQHTIRLLDIINNSIMLQIQSEPIDIELSVNQSQTIQLDNETLKLTLNRISGNTVNIEFEKIKLIVEDVIVETINEPLITSPELNTSQNENNIPAIYNGSNLSGDGDSISGELDIHWVEIEEDIHYLSYILLGILILALIIYLYSYLKKKENMETEVNKK